MTKMDIKYKCNNLEYYYKGQNESEEYITELCIQNLLTYEEIHYLFLGALRKDRIDLCDTLYSLGYFFNFNPSVYHAEHAVSKEACDFLKEKNPHLHPYHIDFRHGVVGKCRFLSLDEVQTDIDNMPDHELHMYIDLLRGAAENKNETVFKYILDKIDDRVYICPFQFIKMYEWIIKHNFIDKIKLIVKKWEYLKNDKKFLDFLDKYLFDENKKYFNL